MCKIKCANASKQSTQTAMCFVDGSRRGGGSGSGGVRDDNNSNNNNTNINN